MDFSLRATTEEAGFHAQWRAGESSILLLFYFPFIWFGQGRPHSFNKAFLSASRVGHSLKLVAGELAGGLRARDISKHGAKTPGVVKQRARLNWEGAAPALPPPPPRVSDAQSPGRHRGLATRSLTQRAVGSCLQTQRDRGAEGKSSVPGHRFWPPGCNVGTDSPSSSGLNIPYDNGVSLVFLFPKCLHISDSGRPSGQ